MPICVAPVNRVKVKRMQNFPQLAHINRCETPQNRVKPGFDGYSGPLFLVLNKIAHAIFPVVDRI